MTLLDRFAHPGPEFTPLPIWWWSGARVRRDRLKWQMEQLVAQGVRQAVVMCLAPTGPLFGSLGDDPAFLSPQWIELLDGACEDAAELGFRLWMYDQIGFSGANFQGRLTAVRPEFAGQALHRDGDRISVRTSGFDYFGVEACAALIDEVHGELERQVGRWFGTVIPGFFQDELPAMPTWGRDFGSTFAEHYGYELDPTTLFENGDPVARRHYHEHRACLARRAFFDPLEQWFADRGMLCGFDQKSPAREGDPVGGVAVYGDYLDTHRGYGAPGSDHWGDPKVHSSLAHAHGHPRTWIEAFHSSGWGGTLEETYDWLAPMLRRGANLYDPHAVYYSTVGGWWEWAPPSTCWRQPYWPSYHQFATAVTRLCSVLSGGTHVCDTILLYPTTTAQAFTTPDGPLEPALRAARCFHELNGVSAWFAEQRGVLERAGVDHDTHDEHTIAAGTLVHNGHAGLRIGDETYRTVIVPDAELLLPEAAQRLSELAAAGGTVICVGSVPAGLTGATVIARPEDVVPPQPEVRADAPSLLRRYGETNVLLLTAHDELTGTKAPIVRLDNENWHETGFPWEEYWRQLRDNGYEFVPPADRIARVEGLPSRAQQWNPRTGERTELRVVDGVAEVPFTDGPMSLVVFGIELPEPTREPLGKPLRATPLAGPWRALAESTVDNTHGDLAAPDREGVLPIEVWRFDDGSQATFGKFAEDSESCVWSLSRGIQKDPAHNETLGPKGYVPEEFLHWPQVAARESVWLRTHLPLPQRTGLFLAIGSSAARRVFLDGQELPAEGLQSFAGYQSFSALPESTAGRTVRLEIQFTAEQKGPLRASFAVITDPDPYRRPEWLTGKDIGRTFELDVIPEDTVVQVATDGAFSVFVNGTEIGRQGDFSPYPGFREIVVQPYDLREHLRVGQNTILLQPVAEGDAVALDGLGLGLISGPDWGGQPRRSHTRDPRFLCRTPRPHPLPGAHWLEPGAAGGDVVVPVIPDAAPGGERVEELRFPAPLGTTSLRVPTILDTVVRIDDTEHKPVDGRVSLPEPLPAGTPISLRITAIDGRRGGALLDGPVEVTVAETETALLAWEDLGLRALGGQMRYRTTFTAPPGRVALDLGEVRGTADVLVNGHVVDRLVWAPWRTEIPREVTVPGENELEIVVRGTLAGYLDDTSPTTAVAAGQVRTGLFGPVRLIEYGESAL